MPVTVGPYGQSQPSCFDRVKMGFMMGFAVGMAAGALFGTFSCLRYATETAPMDRARQPQPGRNVSCSGLGWEAQVWFLCVTEMKLCPWMKLACSGMDRYHP